MAVRNRPFLLALSIVLMAWAATARAGTDGLKPATLIPQWEPQAQFAGYYVALAKGFFAKRGVDMRILRGGPASPPSTLLRDGRADFGTLFLSTAVLERAKGLPLVNLAQLSRTSQLMLVARKSSGISTLGDFQGKRVSLWGPEFRFQPETLLRRYGVQVTELPQGYTMNLFLRGGVDAMSAMHYNEYHVLLNAGMEPSEMTVFLMRDFGLGFPEDGLYCLESTWRRDPELCRAVAGAVLEGWNDAFEHPEEALDIVMRHVEAAYLPTNRMHQKWMLERMREAMLPEGAARPGPLLSEEYQALTESLKLAGLIADAVPFEEFHVPRD